MTRSTTDSVAQDLQLTRDEALVLTVLQQVMIGRDLVAEKAGPRAEVKTGYRDEFAATATRTYWARSAELPDWAAQSAAAIAAKVPAHQRRAVEAAAAAFGPHIEQRSRALLLAIELVAYQPWGERATWVVRARRDALTAIDSYLPTDTQLPTALERPEAYA